MVSQDVEAILRNERDWVEGEFKKLGLPNAVVSIRGKRTPGKPDRIEFVAELPGPGVTLFGSGFVSVVRIRTHGHAAARDAAVDLIEQVKEELKEQSRSGSAV